MAKPTRILLSLLSAALLLGGWTSVRDLKGGGKPAPPPAYRFGYTNFGNVAFNNFGGGAKGYGLSEPDADGVMTAVGGGSSTPSPNFDAVWEATSSGVLLSTATLPNSTKSTVAVNDAGMIAYYGYSTTQAAYAGMVDVPGVGIVELHVYFRPTAVNNLGQVVGYYGSSPWGELWNVGADGTIQGGADLDDFIPFAINDSGEMAGQQGGHAAIAWFEDDVLQVQTLPGLFAGNYGRATGINNYGEVVGVSASSGGGASISISGYYRPFLWDADTGLVALTVNETGAALDINDHGQVVGWSINSSGYYAFLWENGKKSDLNSLSGVGTKTFRLGTAESINNAGHIIGRSDTYKGTTMIGNGTYLLTPK